MKDMSKRISRSHTLQILSMSKLVNDFEIDPNKVTRVANHYCKFCFYEEMHMHRISTQAFAKVECKCGKIMTFHNGDVDKWCRECSQTYTLCSHCGGEMD